MQVDSKCNSKKIYMSLWAIENQHPPTHHEGWMNGKWSGNSFLLGSSPLANYG
jgi:hypothetical protein